MASFSKWKGLINWDTLEASWILLWLNKETDLERWINLDKIWPKGSYPLIMQYGQMSEEEEGLSLAHVLKWIQDFSLCSVAVK